MSRARDVERRREIVPEAAWRVLTREGPTGLSVRKVAAEAGVPPSSLRYVYPTQASLRDAAVALLIERLEERVRRADATSEGVAGARAILVELLPLDEQRRLEMEVSLSFLTLGLTDEAIGRAHAHTHEAVRRVCAQAVARVGAAERYAPLTHAVVDGLALHLLRTPEADAEQALAALDDHLRHLADSV